MFERILIIGAHFDDSDLAAAGSAAKWAQEGKKVYKLTLTDNNTNFTQKGINVSFDSSVKQSERVAHCLGIEQIDFQYEPCSELTYSKQVMQRVEKIIYDLQIDTVVIHSPNDANQDHIAAFHICSTAARHCKNILLFNINGYVTRVGFAPNFFVDISDTFELKRQALREYGKEHDRFGSLFNTCLERNKVWGYSIEAKAAEGFEILKLQY